MGFHRLNNPVVGSKFKEYFPAYFNVSTLDFMVYRLPPAPPGKTYQLWFITREAKISAGTFQTSEAGEGALRVPLPPEAVQVTAAAVTLEPEGGVPQPTGPIYLYGGV